MRKNKIKVGIIGLSELGQKYLSLMFENQNYEIVSIANTDQDFAQRLSNRYQCSCFNDYRQLILASQIDLLVDASAANVEKELILLALKDGKAVLKLSHSGPIIEDFADILKTASKNNTHFFSANTLAFSPGFTALREYLKTEESSLSDFYLLSAYGAYPTEMDSPQNRWLSDPALANGGVLLQNCFELLLEIIRNLSLPEQVYALTTNLAPDKKQRTYLTEDAAVLTLKFQDRLIGTLEASRVASPPNEYLKIYKPNQCLTATKASFVITDNEDNIVEETTGPCGETTLITSYINSLADYLKSSQENVFEVNSNIILETMALIKAAYLSYRTLMPETPSKITRMASLDSNQLWIK